MINAFQSVALRSSIILNMGFPRGLIPISAVLTETVVLTTSLILIPLMMVVYGVAPTAAILWLPVAFAVTVALSLALAYPAALFGIWYPEMMPFGVSLVRAMFFLATGLVALDQVSGTARDLLPFNPLTGLFESFATPSSTLRRRPHGSCCSPRRGGADPRTGFVPVYRSEQAQLREVDRMTAFAGHPAPGAGGCSSKVSACASTSTTSVAC